MSDKKLTGFRVKSLYGVYDHTIKFSDHSSVTAIIGPNGIGKTICLRLIEALFKRNYLYFATINFGSVYYYFDSGDIVEVRRSGDQHLQEFESKPERSILHFEMRRGASDSSPLRWSINLQNQRKWYVKLRREAPYMVPRPDGNWLDERDGEIINEDELIRRYGSKFTTVREKSSDDPIPFNELLESTECRFIQAQRIILTQISRNRPYDRPSSVQYAITDKSSKLKLIIQREFNKYSNLSQTLERTFPQRAIMRTQSHVESRGIGQQIEELEGRRSELRRVGLLDLDYEAPMVVPEGSLDESTSRVLSVYVKDSNEKIGILKGIYDKLSLFKSLIDDRFYPKTIEMSKENGISVHQEDVSIPLEALSSGEQNQLVLFFELIFESDRESLILIDEPEISLHIAWQRKFIPDLLRVVDINGFGVVLATHSPQLIGNYRELVVELGSVD